MMAAGRAAERGAKVILVEKTHRLGNKLLLTGGGRCNITHKAGLKEFVNAFGKNGRFLYRAFTVFSNRDLIHFFSSRGLEMRVDPDGKVFPADDRAESVLAVLRQYISDHQVRILHNTVVRNIIFQPGESLCAGGVRCRDHGVLNAGKVIVAAGGMSYPKTGSSGDGYKLARQCGHSIVPLTPGLVALESDESFLQELQGITLKDISLSVLVDGKRRFQRRATSCSHILVYPAQPCLSLAGSSSMRWLPAGLLHFHFNSGRLMPLKNLTPCFNGSLSPPGQSPFHSI